MMKEAVIVSAVRSAVGKGKKDGALANVHPTELSACVMSQVPMSGYHTRLSPELTESYIGMGFTAERVADRWKVTREDQDRWALESQQKAMRAWTEGKFTEQVVPVPVEKVRWN